MSLNGVSYVVIDQPRVFMVLEVTIGLDHLPMTFRACHLDLALANKGD